MRGDGGLVFTQLRLYKRFTPAEGVPSIEHRGTKGEIRMRVVVDHDRCEGNGFCVNIAPKVFQLDDDEYAMVLTDPVPVEQEPLVEQAIEACPRAALSRGD